MADGAPFDEVRAGLAQPDRGLWFAPIRHHSPACAWAVRRMIRELRPKHVLIEAPVDFLPHLPTILDPETRPPVAIASLVDRAGEARLAAYYPFCTHSPEYVALVEGAAIGAAVDLIDLPSAALATRGEIAESRPRALIAEGHFDGSDYVDALARRAGCRDGFELWDHLFETRLGTADWRGFFQAVGTYCAGIRAAADPGDIDATGDIAREAHMAGAIAGARAAGGPVVVVVGGFHVPALVGACDAAPSAGSDLPAAHSYLIRYGFAAMDALSGYAAGLPQPGYYDFLWRRITAADGAPRWRETAIDLVSAFVAHVRAEGHPVSLPAQVEMVRVAEALARMRGRPGALRHDLIDAARTVLVKGEAGAHEAWTERLLDFLRGRALGDVPISAGSPPLVEDARRRAQAHRIDISDGARRQRHLDIRRKPAHLATSRFLHAMDFLDSGFARRDAGPDFINGVRTDLLFEDWSYAWSPQVEGRLIEAAALGDNVPDACLGLIERHRRALPDSGQARDLPALVTLFARGILVGLGARLAPFLEHIAGEIRTNGEFSAIAQAFRQFQQLATSHGPMAVPAELDVSAVRAACYLRLVYLCDDLPRIAPDAVDRSLDALRLVMETLNAGANGLDPGLFDDAVDRVAAQHPPPEIHGAVLALSVRSGRRAATELVDALDGQFRGSTLSHPARIGVLRGILATVPSLLWQVEALLAAVDRFLLDLTEDAFLDLLPHLRLALTALNPRETDRLARLIAGRHGVSAATLTAAVAGFGERDLARGLAAERVLRACIEADGLADWLLGETP